MEKEGNAVVWFDSFPGLEYNITSIGVTLYEKEYPGNGMEYIG